MSFREFLEESADVIKKFEKEWINSDVEEAEVEKVSDNVLVLTGIIGSEGKKYDKENFEYEAELILKKMKVSSFKFSKFSWKRYGDDDAACSVTLTLK